MAVIMPGRMSQLGQVLRDTWPALHVLVVGDVMLDKYIRGEVERISPEAPIPIVRVSQQTAQPGGAANVAMNLASLGAMVSLAGVVGIDADGAILAARLTAAGIVHHLTAEKDRPTCAKTRVLGGRQQMLRIDVESTSALTAETSQAILRSVMAMLGAPGQPYVQKKIDAVILSDYAKGLLSPALCQAIIAQCRSLGIPVIVDPKGRGYSRYRGATTLCPNLAELALETDTTSDDQEAVLHAGEGMIAGLACESLTVTLSERGIVVLDGETRFYAPAVARQVFDVSGAGDTVTAVLALCSASGIATAEAVTLANLAAGLVVAKIGTAPVERQELLAAMAASDKAPNLPATGQMSAVLEKISDLETMVSRVAAWRSAGETLVFTNGCFDLLHAGHVRLLEAAHDCGDRLIVGLNSDASVRKLKGNSRPIIAEADRAAMLAALSAVDGVFLFEEETPLDCVLALRPDVLVKGGDYEAGSIVGSTEVRSWGGKTVLVPLHGDRSTTAMIAAVAGSASEAAPARV